MTLLAEVSLASFWGGVLWVGCWMFVAGYVAGKGGHR